MAQSDNGNLFKALDVLPNAHLILANELQDMALCHEPYEHFSDVAKDVRQLWSHAAEILKTIGDQSEETMNKDADIQEIIARQKVDEDQDQVKIVIRELRMMAEGVDRYSAYKGASEWTKNIWYAAAEMLEHRLRQVLH